MTTEGPRGSELSLGDLVLAKFQGYPHWPAKISRPEDWNLAPVPNKYFVQFFVTKTVAFVASEDIEAFTNDVKNKLLAKCRSKTVKHFAPAVKEICQAHEQLHPKDTSTPTNIKCEASSIHQTVPTAPAAAGTRPMTNFNLLGAKIRQDLACFDGFIKFFLKEWPEMRSCLGERESQVRDLETALNLSKSETKYANSSRERERSNALKRFSDFEKASLEKDCVVEAKRQRVVMLESDVVGLRKRVQTLESSLAKSIKEKDVLAREMIWQKKAHEVEKVMVRGEGDQESMLRFRKVCLKKANTSYMNGYADALKRVGIPYSDPIWMGLRFPNPNNAPRVTVGQGISAGTPIIATPLAVVAPSPPVSP